MRAVACLALPITVFLAACGHRLGSGGGGGDGGAPADACMGLECRVVDCRATNKPDTAISGTVFAPNGTLPLYGISVYVPAIDPGPITAGATCARCSDTLPGHPVVTAVTDEHGHFSLIGVPAGDDIPVVITSGKWRRTIVIPHVDACAEHPLPPADTSLPRDRSQGDMPQIAITTGQADSLECLVRKLGVADTEITNGQGGGRVQLYAGEGGQDHFKVGFPGGSGQSFASATTLWSDLAKLKTYDIAMFSCEGAQFAADKPQAAMDAVKAYADFGGRVFASHWHNVWLEGATDEDPTQKQKPPVSWTSLGTWTNRDPSELNADSSALIDEVSNPKGLAFASWMENVQGSTVRDRIDLQNQPPDPDQGNKILSTGRTSLASTDLTRTERWVYLPDQGGGTQNFQFTTPIETGEDQRCGKVVFTDMHVSGTSGTGVYPDSCGTSNEMTPQEKALAFMFFDIASCVGVLF